MDKEREISPTVSVVIPNYNYACHLDARIESVLNQTYQDFELIILDDASTDNSREVIEKYRSHPKVSLIAYNEQNSGKPCMQWEKGARLACGRYVWIAEADDLIEPVFLEKAVAALESNEDAVLFFCGSLQNDGDGVFCKDGFDRKTQPRFAPPAGSSEYVFDGQFYIDNYLVYGNTIYNASGALFRKDAVSDDDWTYVCGLFSVGDWALWSRVASKGKVIISREKLNYFRMHKGSATKIHRRDVRYYLDMLQITRENMTNLPSWYQLAVLNRLKGNVRRYYKSSENRKELYSEFDRMFGSEMLKKSCMAGFVNNLLILTPWHICQKNAHKVRPVRMNMK